MRLESSQDIFKKVYNSNRVTQKKIKKTRVQVESFTRFVPSD